ncbi:uncharacterized protein LOC126665116 [Mercurialis annua]|uniref:uncharacterized protein LOC126665116 n=1 Tax=Mercurialis annua TaxID=3986 RepID=UPI0021606F52|nr:uncharacterized protein LOC126665116 [Mercurialis annua]
MPVQAATFEIKPSTIQLLENRCAFYGLSHEDPNAHIATFLGVLNTFKLHRITAYQIKLRMFPFSLRDKATTIDVALGGSFMQKTYEKALELVEKLAVVSSTWGPMDRRAPSNQKSVMTLNQVKEIEAIKATNASLQAQLDALKKQVRPRNALVAYVQVGCKFCGDYNHSGGECLVTGQALSEQVNYVGGQRQANDSYSNTYNPGWRNHPNLGCRDQ